MGLAEWDPFLPFALEEDTLRNTSAQKQVQRIREAYGTPMRFTLAKILGALPSTARPYSVREPMYRSELAALRTNSRMQALMTWFNVLIPAKVIAEEMVRWGIECARHTALTNDEGRRCCASFRFVCDEDSLDEDNSQLIVMEDIPRLTLSVLGTINPITNTPPI